MSSLVQAPLDTLAREYGLSLVVAFGSTARTGQGRDLDLALQPEDRLRGRPDILTLLEDFSTAFCRHDLDLVWLPDAPWLLVGQVARDGQALFEGQVGAFDRFRETAWWRVQDSETWRRRGRDYLDRFLRKDMGMDRDLVRQRLLLMAQHVSELELVLSHPREEILSNPLLHRTAERTVELLVEGSSRINNEVARSLGVPPSDYYSSFFALTRGWLELATAQELANCARLRNVLVHEYELVTPEQVYLAASASCQHWREYIRRIHGRI